MIKGAIFDADGTLFDSMGIWTTVGSDFLLSLGDYEPEEDINERFKSMSLYQSACYYRDVYNVPHSIEELCDGINKWVEDHYFNDVELKPGVRELLEGLHQRGVKMCVASASEKYQIEAGLKRCGVRHYFEDVLSVGDIGHGKDEPVIFRMAQALMGTEKEETYVFEDALYSVKTAREDGFKTIAVYDKYMSDHEELAALSECYIKDYRDIDDFWHLLDC